MLIWTLAGLYLALTILTHVPAVQTFIGSQIAAALSEKLATKVWVGRVDVGLLNRIIVDEVRLQDQRGKEMLRASRISVKISILDLTRGDITISSAQLFGLKANLYKQTAKAPLNCQFVLDSLASKDTTQSRPLHLQLGSLIIRHGEVSYNQIDAPRKKQLDPNHLHITGLSSHIMLHVMQGDSLNLAVKRLQLQEQSGLDLRELSLHLNANRREASLTDFRLVMPQSELLLGDITATYEMRRDQIDTKTLKYKGSIPLSYVASQDLVPLLPAAEKLHHTVLLQARFAGTANGLTLHQFDASMPASPSARQLSAPAIMRASLSGSVSQWQKTPVWSAQIGTLMTNQEGLKLFAGELPEVAGRMEHFSYSGHADGYGRNISTHGLLESGVGNASVKLVLSDNSFAGHVETAGINLRQLLADEHFGMLATNIDLSGNLDEKRYKAQGTVSRIEYNGYNYQNIHVDGTYYNNGTDGQLSIDDPELAAQINGKLTLGATPATNLTAQIRRINPAALHLAGGRLGNAVYSADITAAFTGNSLNTAMGSMAIRHLTRTTADESYLLDSLRLDAGNHVGTHFLQLRSDFARLTATGRFDYATIAQSVKNAIAIRLPSIQHLTPIKFVPTPVNDFTLDGTISRSDWLQAFLGIDLQLAEPLDINAAMRHDAHKLAARIEAPALTYGGTGYKDINIVVTSPGDNLNLMADVVQVGKNGRETELHASTSAADDHLTTALSIDNHATKHRVRGEVNADVQFGRNASGASEARMKLHQSNISLDDSIFSIHPATVVYSRNHLAIDRLEASCGPQRVLIDGITTRDTADSLTVDLHQVNVAYILDLVNFHSVDFSGYATGRAHVQRLFGQPDARAQLRVDDFRFEEGRMGTLHANVNWNRKEEQIDIDAQAIDTMLVGGALPRQRVTDIHGYVSPKRNYIDLGIAASNTRLEFLETFCSSFMRRADLTGNGKVTLWGDLKKINLTGDLVADGIVELSALNTTYTLRNAKVSCGINEIIFPSDTIYDRDNHVAILTGRLTHQHLSRIGFDLDVDARNFLGYDWGATYGSTFYGTVWATGHVGIKGQPDEVIIDVEATPEKGSVVTYDVSSPDAIGNQEFIRWTSRDSLEAERKRLALNDLGRNAPASSFALASPARSEAMQVPALPAPPELSADIRINFLLNTTPDATLHLLMDKASGDYINLNGSGTLRVGWYNKGGLDIFGTYLVDHGVYKMTIQNVIKRDFQFSSGGTIVFGGDPYDARLNLNAQYVIPSVSLSDLQIGRSFASNNIQVTCLMNITNTPADPKVDFDLDLPSMSSDTKQLVMSLINSEEEMKQQVIYLLAVGRFMAQGSNNMGAGGSNESQTSLAMQSILSGQISQQLNTVLSNVVKNVNWNFGANISTGDEGWNNAEYEGLLSGRMLNNRLLFDGQFGYRDNPQATTSFIGDFDLRYLITPNGDISIHMYNQTNDRYFTRSSLNTQGVGFILKRDFDSWSTLFRRKKKAKTPVPDSQNALKPEETPTDSTAE